MVEDFLGGITYSSQRDFTVTTRLPSVLLTILYNITGLNILKLIDISSKRRLKVVKFVVPLLPAENN